MTPRQGIARARGRRRGGALRRGQQPRTRGRVARRADAAVVVAADCPARARTGVPRPRLRRTAGRPRQGHPDRARRRRQPAHDRRAPDGGPVLTPWRGRVAGARRGVVPRAAGGTALARVLFGDVDAGGRLPATFPAAARDLPTAGDPAALPGVNGRVFYDEGVLVGYRWYDARRIRPAYPFGHGLSYTRFSFRDCACGGRASASSPRRSSATRAAAPAPPSPSSTSGCRAPRGACSRRSSSAASRG